MHHGFPAFVLVSFTATVSAQVLPGDIGVTGFSTSAFGVATPPTVTGYTTAGFQGTGSATSQAIVHDPNNFNDFIIAGFGFVGRATITGPGTVSYTLITNGVGSASQISWDGANNIIVADANTHQVRRVTTAGVVTDLSIGTQPWGTSVNAGAYEPATGDVIVGNNGGLYRLPNGLTTGVPIVTGLGGFVSAVAFDPCTGDILATVLAVNRVVRVTAAGVVTNIVGNIPSPNSLGVDRDGNLIVGGNIGSIWRIPYGGLATVIATNTSPSTSVCGLSIAKTGGFAGPFGAACSATSGAATLSATGPYAVGVPFTTTSVNHQPFAIGLWIIGLSRTIHLGLPLPLLLDPFLGTSSCYLNVSADVTSVAFSDAAGAMAVSFTPTAPFAGQEVFIQHMVVEGVPGGFSFSNGVCVHF